MLDKYLGVIRCGSRAIWAKNCKCTPRESGGGWQQRRCSIGVGGGRGTAVANGGRSIPALSLGLCVPGTLLIWNLSGRIKTEPRWLNWNLSSPWKFEIKAAANWADSGTREILGEKVGLPIFAEGSGVNFSRDCTRITRAYFAQLDGEFNSLNSVPFADGRRNHAFEEIIRILISVRFA